MEVIKTLTIGDAQKRNSADFIVESSKACQGCIFRPTEANGGLAAGCLPQKIGSFRERIINWNVQRVAEAIADGDPSNCGIITTLREQGYPGLPALRAAESPKKESKVKAFFKRRLEEIQEISAALDEAGFFPRI